MIFGKRATAVRDDPVFGPMKFNGTEWQGTVPMGPDAKPTLVAVEAGEDGPAERHYRAYRELQSQLADLREQLSAALHGLYVPYLELPDWNGPRPASAQALREMVELSSVHLSDERPPELLFSFKDELWPDAMFIVEIRDGRVVGISLDD